MANKIMGSAKCRASQMKDYLLKYNSNPKINCSVDELVRYYLEEGRIEGIRGDIAFAQALIETGYFKFGGIVLPNQNNYCGLGALNNNGVGGAATFESPRIGVRAQIQHLKAYATSSCIKMQCVDPRYRLVTKGVAPNVEDLGGKWAVPGYDSKKYSSFQQAFASNATYGQKIMNVVNKIMQMPVSSPVKNTEVQEEFMDDEINNEFIQNEAPQQGNQLDTSTSGIIAAFLDLLVTLVSAWQTVDDEPDITPSKKKKSKKSKKVKKNPKK